MGLFSNRKPEPPAPNDDPVRGGCSKCDMHGPTRRTFREASADANAHSDRMHGGWANNPNAYVESVPLDERKRK